MQKLHELNAARECKSAWSTFTDNFLPRPSVAFRGFFDNPGRIKAWGKGGGCKMCIRDDCFPGIATCGFPGSGDVCGVITPSPQPGNFDAPFAAFLQRLSADVPAELSAVRTDVAKLLLAAILLRVGLPQSRLGEVIKGFSLPAMASGYSRLLDGNRATRWFMEAVDRHEDEVRGMMRERLAGDLDFSQSAKESSPALTR
jgi:hypothetical protein